MGIASLARHTPVTAPSNPLIVPYVEWQPSYRGSVRVLDELPRSSAQVQAAIRTVVAAEGPVRTARLAKLVASEFGLDRVAQAQAAAILRCVPADLPRSIDEPFY